MADVEEQSSGDEAESTSSVVERDTGASFRRSSFALSKQLVANLDKRGLTVPTEVQTQVIPRIRDSRGKDICVNAPTGSGKTLAYALPITQVLSPAKSELTVGSGEETVHRPWMCCRRPNS
jgi:superfamily II DNA/RNA helicase